MKGMERLLPEMTHFQECVMPVHPYLAAAAISVVYLFNVYHAALFLVCSYSLQLYYLLRHLLVRAPYQHGALLIMSRSCAAAGSDSLYVFARSGLVNFSRGVRTSGEHLPSWICTLVRSLAYAFSVCPHDLAQACDLSI
eukprot:gnl/TRDRNA2_/TRDRNA2_126734_c2_seq1.p1 gnl/TRDRNA2_/TRDRNA2_126734_c2~~gnl/TRDRNA2_/TRDRNA2_126734_c2_seq1.p1  ORF type:complete len:139 (-),score=2.22 gnl/TRDRNA2_/TRDRNA2_126734_c2_seq1:109-525(-)